MLDVCGGGFDTLCELALVPEYFAGVGASHNEAESPRRSLPISRSSSSSVHSPGMILPSSSFIFTAACMLVVRVSCEM